MRRRRLASLVLVASLVLGACGSDDDPFAGEGAPTDAAQGSGERNGETNGGTNGDRPSRTTNRDQDDPPTEVKRPRAGEYVYEIVGVGATILPPGTVIEENLSASGDAYTVNVTNSRNDNRQQLSLRWESSRVVQLTNEVVRDGERITCTYNPPRVLLHNPLRVEDYPDQRYGSSSCEQRIEVSVVERTSAKDKKGKAWDVWMIQVRRHASGRRDEETHWFSHELGRDIRIETGTETQNDYNQTLQILSSYPGPV